MPKDRSIVLCLIRCGATAWDVDHRLQGAADLPLSEAGRSAILAEAGRLNGHRVATIHHPPDEAAAETARVMAGAMRSRTRSRLELADPHLGLLEGMANTEFADRFPKRYRKWQDDVGNLVPPEGEPIADARTRILSAIARVLSRTRSREVGVVLHPLGTGMLACALGNVPLTQIWSVVERQPPVERYLVAPGAASQLLETA